ncbi:HAD family hydrolase [Pokkaliibacter sp. CJK22405]|uniref:HAD family hydrolase n=1 Tax=Pokkaliibacter sp. CJK22405 TaxID=3384615 RepID=UPI0039854997
MSVSALPEALLFDLDGTLLDTAPDFYRVINQQLREAQRDERSYEFVRARVSHGASALVCGAFDITPEHAEHDVRRARLLELYLAEVCVDTSLFAGLESSLNWARQRKIPWGIITNKPRLYSEALMAALPDLADCAVLVCPDDVTHRKPHPEPMYLACAQLNVSPDKCVYVGDHQRDIDAGKAAGMMTVAAAYGYVDEDSAAETWGADVCIASGAELVDWLKRSYE